jgi:hypothetical protein
LLVAPVSKCYRRPGAMVRHHSSQYLPSEWQSVCVGSWLVRRGREGNFSPRRNTPTAPGDYNLGWTGGSSGSSAVSVRSLAKAGL